LATPAEPEGRRRPGPLILVSFLVAVGLAVVAVVAFIVLPRQRSERGPTPIGPPRGEITVAYPHAPLTFNPYTYEGDTMATRDLVRPVLPTLLQIGPDLRYRPALATRVPAGRDIDPTPFSVTFHLNPRAVWSDGKPVTAEDVRFTWQAILDPRYAIADRSAYERVKDVVVVDDHTVRLVFDGYYLWWPDLFSAGDFVLPKHDLEGKDVAAELRDGIRVGAGPFVIKSWTPGLDVVYAANPRWWGRGPGLEQVRVVIVPDPEMATQLLERRDVQAVALTTEPNVAKRLQGLPGMHVSSRFGSAWWELVLNGAAGRLTGNFGFRQAVASSIDRPSMVEAFVGEDGRGLDSLVPGWEPGTSKEYAGIKQDIARAKELLAHSGVQPGAVSLVAPATSEVAGLFQRAVQAGLRETGIPGEIVNPPEDRFYGQWLRDGRFDLAFVERRGSPLMAVAGTYRSTRHPPAGINYARASSPVLDEALDALDAVKKLDPALPDVLTRRLAAALPALPLFEAKAFIANVRSVLGPSANATLEGPFWNLEEWRLQEGAPEG
jgi:peptide/nickel transport system substrate-binding protein